MSGVEYIRREKELMEKAYKRDGTAPEKWIFKNAKAYYQKHAASVGSCLKRQSDKSCTGLCINCENNDG